MQIKLGVLGEGDEIFDIWDTRIAIKRKNSQIEILDYCFDEEGILRIKPLSIILSNTSDMKNEILEIGYYLLDEGDEVFKICYDQIFIKRKSKEVEIFSIVTNDDGCYLEKNTIIVTFGNKVVSVNKPGSAIEIGTF